MKITDHETTTETFRSVEISNLGLFRLYNYFKLISPDQSEKYRESTGKVLLALNRIRYFRENNHVKVITKASCCPSGKPEVTFDNHFCNVGWGWIWSLTLILLDRTNLSLSISPTKSKSACGHILINVHFYSFEQKRENGNPLQRR